ncbi:hypothetical protein SAMN05920897_1242 [Alkalispirochaeta americana]|uniref:Uncharacterized protein n=1 Tax=Alkalispirochaeta americana TaxID=159291 RepID=A0A1N6XFT7_9SPIO|nr:hypothetical protein [Alkalispirochaeta americana]SIR01119.1 hypothetical protein SAMN05920897_1242 [Alkalispirochaeta americana]
MSDDRELAVSEENEITKLVTKKVSEIRPELQDNPYIEEAVRVLQVEGYRSAIGNIWNAVVDDLRNKIIHRSLPLFNKEMKSTIGRECNTYDDFQNHVNDDNLITGAYKIGVIGWEAQKVLKHSKETRHIFDGHPRSSNPSLIKVLGMLEDCIKYVLKEEYPLEIINIDEYIELMDSSDYDRNSMAIENSLGDLPDIYKDEMIHRFLTSYVDANCSTVLRSSIEFCAPILWKVLTKSTKNKVVKRVDAEIGRGNSTNIEYAFQFVEIVNAQSLLSLLSRKYKIEPLIKELEENVDNWEVENRCVKELSRYSSIIPSELLNRYVNALTQTYVGTIGHSLQFSRTDFYADGAALYIPDMFQYFDDSACDSFLESIRNNRTLRSRIEHPRKMRRLRSLGNVLIDRVSQNYHDKKILEALVDEEKEEDFIKMVKKKTT